MTDRYLVIGGGGFIGSNLADHAAATGRRITILDDFSRRGSRLNAEWLKTRHHEGIDIVEADVRRMDGHLQREVARADVVFHLAGQVAVTTSIADPRTDFEANALGTLNVLEAARLAPQPPIVVYASTNKVYGDLGGRRVVEQADRNILADLPAGVPETEPLDFRSPYGCSKGAGDQYTLDYARIYGLRTVVFRQSCVYGPRQFGTQDQGWLTWFAIRGLLGQPVMIFGDGKQVRDVLYVGDLVEALELAVAAIETTAGRAYNIGGGPENALSLLDLVELLSARFEERLRCRFADRRPGDQRVYVSDWRRAARDFGWRPRVGVEEGIDRLVAWLEEHREDIASLLSG